MEPRPPWTDAAAEPEPADVPAPAPEPAPAEQPAPEAPEAGAADEPVAVVAEAPGPGPVADGRPTLDLDAVTADLAAVEAALERLDQGGYGRCGACASVIDDDVLAADPTATTCAAHLPV